MGSLQEFLLAIAHVLFLSQHYGRFDYGRLWLGEAINHIHTLHGGAAFIIVSSLRRVLISLHILEKRLILWPLLTSEANVAPRRSQVRIERMVTVLPAPELALQKWVQAASL